MRWNWEERRGEFLSMFVPSLMFYTSSTTGTHMVCFVPVVRVHADKYTIGRAFFLGLRPTQAPMGQRAQDGASRCFHPPDGLQKARDLKNALETIGSYLHSGATRFVRPSIRWWPFNFILTRVIPRNLSCCGRSRLFVPCR